MNNIQRSRCYNKLGFSRSITIQLKDQTKKTEEQNIKTWPAKKPNIKKTLMGGRPTIDMHGTWHPIWFNEDGMAW
jgi:hypothetical protein